MININGSHCCHSTEHLSINSLELSKRLAANDHDVQQQSHEQAHNQHQHHYHHHNHHLATKRDYRFELYKGYKNHQSLEDVNDHHHCKTTAPPTSSINNSKVIKSKSTPLIDNKHLGNNYQCAYDNNKKSTKPAEEQANKWIDVNDELHKNRLFVSAHFFFQFNFTIINIDARGYPE